MKRERLWQVVRKSQRSAVLKALVFTKSVKNLSSISILALIAPSILMGLTYENQFYDSVFSDFEVYANSNELVRFYFYCALSFIPSFAVMSFQSNKSLIMSMLLIGFCSNIALMIDAIDLSDSPLLYAIDDVLQIALMTTEGLLIILWIISKFLCSWLCWWLVDTWRLIWRE